MTLVWHRTNNDSEKRHVSAVGPLRHIPAPSPQGVHVWIEPGSQLRSTLLQPRLVCKPVQSNARAVGGQDASDRLVRSIDLLDIGRVLEARRVDRVRHPLAKRDCSFLVETLDRTGLLFQAESESERDRIVHGLKLVVARLGSKIVVGDGTVIEEFFTPFGLSVPGYKPAWAQTESRSCVASPKCVT